MDNQQKHMYQDLKHFPVNWVDGMKVKAADFIQTDLFVMDWFRDVYSMNLNEYTYGLFPESSFQIEEKHVEEQVILTLAKCQAITSNGLRIEITDETAQQGLLAPSIMLRESEDCDIVLEVERYEAGMESTLGKPIAGGNPRFSHAFYRYALKKKASSHSSLPHQLKVAEWKKGHQSSEYVPPCLTIHAHTDLLRQFHTIISFLNVIERGAKATISTFTYKIRRDDAIKSDAYELAQKILAHLINTSSELRLIGHTRPPWTLIAYAVTWAKYLAWWIESLGFGQELVEKALPRAISPEAFMKQIEVVHHLTADPADLYHTFQQISIFFSQFQELMLGLSSVSLQHS